MTSTAALRRHCARVRKSLLAELLPVTVRLSPAGARAQPQTVVPLPACRPRCSAIWVPRKTHTSTRLPVRLERLWTLELLCCEGGFLNVKNMFLCLLPTRGVGNS